MVNAGEKVLRELCNGGQAFLIVVIEGRGTIARLFSVVPMGLKNFVVMKSRQ